jgi:hypothetical protein
LLKKEINEVIQGHRQICQITERRKTLSRREEDTSTQKLKGKVEQ